MSTLYVLVVGSCSACRSATWSFENQKDVRKRPTGAVQNPNKDAVSDPRGFLGISKSFGFTKANEVSQLFATLLA